MLFTIFLCGVIFGGIVAFIVTMIWQTIREIKEEKERLFGITKTDDMKNFNNPPPPTGGGGQPPPPGSGNG